MPVTILRPTSAGAFSGATKVGTTSVKTALSDGSDSTYLNAVANNLLGYVYHASVAAPTNYVMLGITGSMRGKHSASSGKDGVSTLLLVNNVFAAEALMTSSALNTVTTNFAPYGGPLSNVSQRLHTYVGGALYDAWITRYTIPTPTVGFDVPASVTEPITSTTATVTSANDTTLTAMVKLRYSVHSAAEYTASGFVPSLDNEPSDTISPSESAADFTLGLGSLSASTTYRIYYQVAVGAAGTYTWNGAVAYHEFATTAFPIPAQPVITPTVHDDLSVSFVATTTEQTTEQLALFTYEYLIIERSDASGPWEQVVAVPLTNPSGTVASPAFTVTVSDLTRNPSVASAYRAYATAIYTTSGVSVRSADSTTANVAAATSVLPSIRNAGGSLYPAFFVGWAPGTIGDDTVTLWPQGSDTPYIERSARRKQSGTMSVQLSGDTEHASAQAIADADGYCYLITPDLDFLRVALYNITIARQDSIEKSWLFSASWQEL